MRLWAAKRLPTDASMSLPPGTSWPTSQRLLFQRSSKSAV